MSSFDSPEPSLRGGSAFYTSLKLVTDEHPSLFCHSVSGEDKGFDTMSMSYSFFVNGVAVNKLEYLYPNNSIFVSLIYLGKARILPMK